MTANHAHTPTVDELRRIYALKVPHDQRDRRNAEFDRFLAAVEQRGAAALALELFPLMCHIQNLPSRYTRAPGPEGNGDRVADLLSQDAYEIGTQALDMISEALQHTDQEDDDGDV